MSAADKWVRAIRAGLQFIPHGIGSAIDTAYFGTIDDRRVARLEAFMKALAADVRTAQGQIGSALDAAELAKRFGSDEFAYIFESVLRRVNTEVVQEKLQALRGVLVTVIVADAPCAFEKQVSFLKSVDVVEGTHIRILQWLASRREWPDQDRYASRDEICDHLGAKTEADIGYVHSVLDTLANREFIISGPIPFDSDGKLARSRQAFRATALGLEFLDFIRMAPTSATQTRDSDKRD